MRRIGFLVGFVMAFGQIADAAEVGDAVPVFALRGLAGELYTSEAFRGQVLVLYFLGYD